MRYSRAILLCGVGLIGSTQAFAQGVSPQATAADGTGGQSGQAAVAGNVGEAPATAVDDIVVTAQKRSERLQEVPIAISAFSGDTLKEKGVANITDLPDITPGLRMISPGTGGNLALSIRGVGQRDININNESPVAMYVDGSYVSLSTALAQPIYDVERVEVLKGPQGTLFGRNATGGLVHIISVAPSQSTSGFLSGQYGSYDSYQVEGAVGGGLTESLAARISFHTEGGGRFMKNTVPGLPDHNGNHNYAGRLQLLYSPNSDFSVLWNTSFAVWPSQPGPAPSNTRLFIDPATGDHLKPSSSSFAAYQAYCGALTGGAAVPTVPGPLGNCYTTLRDDYHGGYNADGKFKETYFNTSATVNWTFGSGITLTSISDYQLIKNMQLNIPLDSVGTDLANYRIAQPKAYQLSQELRLSGDFPSGRWIVGAYGLYINNHGRNETDLTNAPGYFVNLTADFRQISKSIAGFAEVSYDLSDKVTFIVGGRVTRDRKTIDNDSGCISNPAIPVDICAAIRGSNNPPLLAFNGYEGGFSKTSWSGRAVVQWKPTRDIMVYAGVNRGVKTGGFNSGAVELYTLDQVPYQGETLYNFEGGVKASLFDRRLTVDASAFYYDYRNYQTYTAGSDGGLRTFNVNASIKGAEAALVARPFDGLELRGSMTYIDTKQKDIPFTSPSGVVSFNDYPIADAPEFSADLSLRYGFDIGPGELSAMISESHVSSRTLSPVVFKDEITPAYDRMDLRVGFDTHDDKWSAAFSIRNLTKEVIYSGRVNFETLYGGVYNGLDKPRWFSVSLTRRF